MLLPKSSSPTKALRAPLREYYAPPCGNPLTSNLPKQFSASIGQSSRLQTVANPSQRARGSKKFILARTHQKTIPPCTKFSFSHEIFILGLKFSFSIENFNPRPCFSAAREVPGMKKNHSRLKISFCIESLIFSISPLEIDFFQSWGPLGWRFELLRTANGDSRHRRL